MRIGVISNTDSFLPFVYTLAAQQLQVYIFFSDNKDPFVNQRVEAFVQQTKISFTKEQNAEKDLYQWLLTGNYDVCFVLGYSKLIDLKRLKGCSTQLFNIHFGPLPGFRGPVPVFWQLKKGVEKVGIAIHRVSSKFDDGPIVWMKETDNLSHYNYQLVNQILSQLCIEGVLFIIRLLMQRLLLPVISNAVPSAYQKRPGLNDVSIRWHEMEANEICDLVRACNPWNKGALSSFQKREIKLMDAVLVRDTESSFGQHTPGTIIEAGEKLLIYCKDGNAINVNMLFYNDCFIPAYQCPQWGIVKGQRLE